MPQYGSSLRRLFAFLIDNSIFVFLSAFVRDNQTAQLIVYTGFGTLYFVWMNTVYGATLGKMLMKLKITKEDGSKIVFKDALIREIASDLCFIFFGIGFIPIVWNKRKQGLHDVIAKTVVIRTQNSPINFKINV